MEYLQSRSQEAEDLRREETVEFKEKMDQYFDERGLMMDLDKVKLDGLKPRRLAFPEKTGSRGPPMEVRDLPLMPSSASLSSKKSLYKLEMRRLPFEKTVGKMNQLDGVDFERIQEVHGPKFCPIQNPDPSLGITSFSVIISTKRAPMACPNENC